LAYSEEEQQGHKEYSLPEHLEALSMVHKTSAGQEGFSLVEILVAIAVFGILTAVLSANLTMTSRAGNVNQSILNFDLLVGRVNNMFKDSNICENTNIVTTGLRTLSAGFTTTPISSLTELTLGTQKIIEKKWDTSRQFKVTVLELWQQTPPAVPVVLPQKFFARLHIEIRPDRDNSAAVVRDIPLMITSDASGKITSCYSQISRRIPCEDLGWVYDGTKTPDCAPP
jgi:prepilin-type N-terminal cleavage/methylation domain-containing protein